MKFLIVWFRRTLCETFVPIRIKLLASLFAIVFLFGTVDLLMTYGLVMKFGRIHQVEISELLRELASDRMEQHVLHRDTVSLQLMVKSLVRRQTSLLYVVIYDRGGMVISHSFEGRKLPRFLVEAPATTGTRLLEDTAGERLIKEYAFALKNGRLGQIVFGFDESKLRKDGQTTTGVVGIMISSFLVLGSLLVIFFVYLYTRPVKEIIRVCSDFDPHIPPEEVKILFNDELRMLGDELHGMMMRLYSTDKEFKLAQARIVESEKFASIGMLASGVAHEIHNPVGGILLACDRLSRSAESVDRVMEYVSMIEEGARHIHGVTSGLLDLSRQDQKHRATADLRSCLDTALLLMRYRIEKSGMELIVDLCKESLVARINSRKIVQILVNGILNAIDASAKENADGTVALLGKKIVIRLYNESGQAIFEIVDKGEGVTEEVMKRAFDPFFTSKGRWGTGLGLYVSKKIAEEHDGELKLMNHEGGGAILQFRIPLETKNENLSC